MLLHRLPPERAHSLTVRAAQAAGAVAALGWMANKVWGVPSYPVTAMGLQFSNRVGIAATLEDVGRARQLRVACVPGKAEHVGTGGMR